MSRLFNRSYKLIIDDIEIEGGGQGDSRFGLDVAFKIETTTQPTPNKATIQIWNLNADHRSELQKRSGSEIKKGKRQPIAVEFHAGYQDDRGVIFRGDLRNLRTVRDGADFVTEISGSDGGTSYKVATVSRSFSPGTRIADVMNACVDAMGIGEGNLGEFSSSLSIKNLGATFPEGHAVSGPAEKALDHLVRSCGLAWSIQKGVLQLRERGKPVDREVFQLSADSGLIGTPVAEIDTTVLQTSTAGAPKQPSKVGSVKVQCLLLHQLYAGAKVNLDAETFKGDYQISQLTFAGDSAGDDWMCDMDVRPF